MKNHDVFSSSPALEELISVCQKVNKAGVGEGRERRFSATS